MRALTPQTLSPRAVSPEEGAAQEEPVAEQAIEEEKEQMVEEQTTEEPTAEKVEEQQPEQPTEQMGEQTEEKMEEQQMEQPTPEPETQTPMQEVTAQDFFAAPSPFMNKKKSDFPVCSSFIRSADVVLSTPFPRGVLHSELCSTCILPCPMALGDSLLLWREKTVPKQFHSLSRFGRFVVWTVARSTGIPASGNHPIEESSKTSEHRCITRSSDSDIASGELSFAGVKDTHFRSSLSGKQTCRYWLCSYLCSLLLLVRMKGSVVPIGTSSAV